MIRLALPQPVYLSPCLPVSLSSASPVRLASLLWQCLSCAWVWAADEPAECPWCGSGRVRSLED